MVTTPRFNELESSFSQCQVMDPNETNGGSTATVLDRKRTKQCLSDHDDDHEDEARGPSKVTRTEANATGEGATSSRSSSESEAAAATTSTDYDQPDWSKNPKAFGFIQSQVPGVPSKYLVREPGDKSRTGYLFGRGDASDIYVDSREVSRRHCILYTVSPEKRVFLILFYLVGWGHTCIPPSNLLCGFVHWILNTCLS